MPSDVNPVDPTTPVGQVRILIGDTAQKVDPAAPTLPAQYIFSDAFIQGFISLNPLNIRFAAADAVDTLASNEALVSKKIRTESLQTDGPAVANALRMHAENLRTQGKLELARADQSEVLEIVDYQKAYGYWEQVEMATVLGLGPVPTWP